MTADVLLVGPAEHSGGERVYVQTVAANPPDGVRYRLSGGFHSHAEGARSRVVEEVLLNRLAHPRGIPDMGFRSLRLRPGRFDLVHVHAHPVRIGGAKGVPLVMSEGSSAAVYLGEYLGWSDQRLADRLAKARRLYRRLGVTDRLLTMERAAAVYVFSEWAREVNIRWGADPSKVRVLPPGFEVRAEVSRPDRSEVTFLFVGREFGRKGGFDVIEAFATLARDRPEVRLVLAGADPSAPDLDAAARQWVSPERRRALIDVLSGLEAAGRATQMPWVPRERLLGEVYPAADVFVMPTLAEGFGFTNVEAMGMGLPVITSTAGPSAEIVSEGRTGLLIAPGDVDALADSMNRLAAGDALRADMSRAAREDFLERFTLDRFRADLGRMYREVMA
jgi:glycosyltransferase involved in cell wall biosynthesis